MNKLKIYNTLNNKKEDFVPIDEANIRMYTCGPTVYNYAHIGNARPSVVSDVLVRVLRVLYPKVTYVSNITDIDDKIINASNDTGKSIKEITKKFEGIYNDDMASLHVNSPDIQPRATEYISDMISLVKKLIESGCAYEADNHVLFHVPSYKSYGALSGRNREDQIAGSRVEVASFKRDPGDFVLWKPSTEDQPGWNSPWGFGRPGWHLECSTMSEKNLGLPFDIHGGGLDLIFPHHENEIAQSCGAHGHHNNPQFFAKYWIHNGLLDFDGEKMSKSIGNIEYIHDLTKKHSGEVLRLALLSTHYRQPLNWNDEIINQCQTILDRLYRVLKSIEDIDCSNQDKKPSVNVLSALCDDLNTSKALAEINEIANKISKAEDDQKKAQLKSQLLSSTHLLGLLNDSPDNWLGYGKTNENVDEGSINQLINDRNAARSNKDYQKADEIRNQLNDMGIEIEDTPEGTIWKTKK